MRSSSSRLERSRDGVLLIDKPSGWTSHDVVGRVRRLAETRKVGHAGTLDPMATGLLVLGVGTATRLLTHLVGLPKEYTATIRLGESTTTDDAEGEIVERAESAAVAGVTDKDIENAVRALTGQIEQVPSSVSAIKVNGERAYARVRAGEDVQLASRTVTVSEFVVAGTSRSETFIDLPVRVRCSSGTYIRALARDVGAALRIGGHLTVLRRTSVGPFKVSEASSLEVLDVDQALLSPAAAAVRVMPRLDLTGQQAVDLGHGKKISVDSEQVSAEASDRVAAVAPDERLVGVVAIKNGVAMVVTNFPVPSGGAGV